MNTLTTQYRVVGRFRIPGADCYGSASIAVFKSRAAAERRKAKEECRPFERTGYSYYEVWEER